MSNKYDIRSGLQSEFMFAISLVEKARYLSECSQQLCFDVLKQMLPVIKNNYNKIKSIVSSDIEFDIFHLDLQFVLKCCVYSHDKVIRAIESSYDDKTLYDAICRENEACILDKLCSILSTLWIDYWKHFHQDNDKMDVLLTLESELVQLYSCITLKGNESLPSNYRCLSCILDSAYVKTGRLNMCDDDKNKDNSKSLNYCYHLIDTNKDSKYCNLNRAIFERRLNEKGILQH